MRRISLLVLLTTILASPTLADRKHPYGVDAGMGIQPAPQLNFRGTAVYNWIPEDGWQGFGFAPNPTLTPLVFPFVQSLGGTPTLDRRQSKVFASWGFVCWDPRVTDAGVGCNSWNREGGVRFTNEKFIVQVTMCFYECNAEPIDPSDPNSEVQIVRGRLIAGPYVGTGKANATVDWGAFLNSFGWARGINFNLGQTEMSDARLQLKALTEAFKNLKLVAPVPPPF